jgi:hypothetical protein
MELLVKLCTKDAFTTCKIELNVPLNFWGPRFGTKRLEKPCKIGGNRDHEKEIGLQLFKEIVN